MKNKHLYSLSIFTTLIATSPSTTLAFPPVDLPEQAQVRVAPHRKFEIQHGNLHATVQPLYTTVDAPSNHEINAGGIYDGVARLILTLSSGTFGCTGALLNDGIHILTAAHCLTDTAGNDIFISGTATFEDELVNEEINIIESVVHPDWDGEILRGNDIAVLTLSEEASVSISRYDIDTNKNDDLTVVEKAGYGMSGTGDTGVTEAFGTKRGGQNKYDAVADTMLKALGLRARRDFVPGSVLQYDFDNGNTENDAFGFFFGIHGLGLGLNEVSSAPGDSGGPSISMGKVTGVTSYGLTLTLTDGSTSDVTNDIDSSFGEFSADTRVSKYSNWINSTISSDSGDDGDSSEPNCSRGRQRRGLC